MWVRNEGARVRVGITDVAQSSLGEVVFADLPSEGQTLDVSKEFAWLESSKAIVDLFPPVSGVVREANSLLLDAPGNINQDPYGAGWLCVIEPSDPGGRSELLDAGEYSQLIDDAT